MDNVIKGNFGGSVNTSTPKDSEVEKMVDLILDRNAPVESGAYQLVTVLHCPQELDRVPDLATGGERNKKWGAAMNLALVPGLDKNEKGSVTMPTSPAVFFDADTLDDLRARLYYEVDKAIEVALAASNTELFTKVQARVMEEIASSEN